MKITMPMKINAPHDTEIQHVVTDAKTNEVVPFLINTDYHGMTVEFPNGQFITLDLSDGVVSVYHNVDGDDTGTKVHEVKVQ